MAVISDIQIGDTLVERICEALDIDANMTRRIILDFQMDTPVIAYIEMYGSNAMCDIVWSLGKDDGAQIKIIGEE